MSVQLFFLSVGLYRLVLWLPKMIHDRIGGSLGTAGLYSAAPNLLGIILALGASFASDQLLRRKALVWPFLLVGSAAFIGSTLRGPALNPIAQNSATGVAPSRQIIMLRTR